MSYLSPPTLAHSEQEAILRTTACNPRDPLIYALALGTGLRLAEIVGLSVADVYTAEGRPRNRLRIRPEIAKGLRTGDVLLPDALVGKLRRFWAHKAQRREVLARCDPLLCSQTRVRISKHCIQFAFRTWQVKAWFDRLYPFHALKHTAVTNVYRARSFPTGPSGSAQPDSRMAEHTVSNSGY